MALIILRQGIGGYGLVIIPVKKEQEVFVQL